ncbi:hypothetical protein Y032_0001g228 [Ancylostoma ceylanicum]|uniref:Uncharacterized protein n=1 Tax=Ancylostoma ceylanicum TaxID=53326 RepID=A0A016W482_9BILA|nr:hypothetical protein Y032_0001g228 [Ancylostoma ceylanicum]
MLYTHVAKKLHRLGVDGGGPSADSKSKRRDRAARIGALSETTNYLWDFLDSYLVFLLVNIKCDGQLTRKPRLASDYPTSEKKEKLDVILARQTELVQKLFALEVERKKLRYQIKMEHRLSRVTDPELIEYFKQVEVIDHDMSISNKEADRKKKELKYQLPPMLRRYVKKL